MIKACLVAYDNEIPPKIIKKAKDLNIEIIAGENISGVKEHIQSWIIKR